ncbi:MAG: glycine cleavage system protein GcvH [Thermoplasmata archaeon]|nr:glycine cleavage system protein GcvH [Thermoplasmata archaeon]NIS13943.1 glycine cleavage system protein GcvH [Thermoplasmata archaeon]NIS21779.1 glycine cleavage system protein GcvH [Thermoplasmata archaeon]NIT79378.1 glycine cleavage system protein GcvH [Thermoplasmata archaeon]NIU50812.1 glycine cleavage system protein GcvH [Thermoplasmata archaeon]
MQHKDYNIPEDVKYHAEHMWARVEGDLVVVGVTDFAQKLAGDIVYVDMPMEGDDVTKDKPFGTLETGKWVGKIYAPVSGEVAEYNEDVEDDALVINEDPYGSGWIIKIEPEDMSEVDGLLNASDYVPIIDAKLEEIQ